jgi:hypothetical protein
MKKGKQKSLSHKLNILKALKRKKKINLITHGIIGSRLLWEKLVKTRVEKENLGL